MPPDRALVAKEVPREAFVDDRDIRIILHVPAVEIAAFLDRESHGLEVAGRNRVHEGLHVLAILGGVAFDSRAAVPLVAAQQRHGGQPRGLHAGDGADLSQKFVVEMYGSRRIVSVERRRNLERHQVIQVVESGVDRFQILQAAHEQSGAEQQQETQRHLSRYQALAQEQ